MFTKSFYVIQEKALHEDRFYACSHELDKYDNFPWELKEYGFESEAECEKDLKKFTRMLKRNNFSIPTLLVKKFDVSFSSKEEYERVKAYH